MRTIGEKYRNLFRAFSRLSEKTQKACIFMGKLRTIGAEREIFCGKAGEKHGA